LAGRLLSQEHSLPGLRAALRRPGRLLSQEYTVPGLRAPLRGPGRLLPQEHPLPVVPAAVALSVLQWRLVPLLCPGKALSYGALLMAVSSSSLACAGL